MPFDWDDAADLEVRLTGFEAALRLLKRRMARSGYGWSGDEARHAMLDGADVFGVAMCHAVHDALWTVAPTGLEEEPLTASLIGGLTTNLTWYTLMARSSEEDFSKRHHCDVYWAHQARHVERWRGADFGIARRLSSEDQLRISLYQAKVAKDDDKADLYRRVHPDSRRLADHTLHRLLKEGHAKYAPDEASHQIQKLFRTMNEGFAHAGVDPKAPRTPEWVRYLFWYTARTTDGPLMAPTTRSVSSLLEEMREKRWNRRDSRFYPSDFMVNTTSLNDQDFVCGDFISTYVGRSSNELIVDMRAARELMGELAKIGMPNFFVADEAGGDDGSKFWGDVFGLTNLTVTFKTGTRDVGTRPATAPSFGPPGG